jgi:signal transduction histidine kinase
MKGLGIIHQCASHLLTLINDILDLSKLEVQKMELYPQDFHLSNFLATTVDICRVKAEQKGVEFRYQPGANLPTAVHSDDKRLRQVLLNLLSNAIKFTDFGTVTFRVEPVDGPTPSDHTCRIRFQVKDTGIGIAPDKLATIFLPFEQAGKRDRNTEGTGLGLAISQQIVEKMGSTIQAESVLGQGSCFSAEFILPPPEELKALQRAAQGGFMADIQQEAERIKQLSVQYVAFANRVLELSQQFDDEAILGLIES